MKDENGLRDLTSFLLEWRDTCAIDKCPQVRTKQTVKGVEIPELHDGKPVYVCAYKHDGESDDDYVARIRADILYVHGLTDSRFKNLVRFPRSPGKLSAAKKMDKSTSDVADDVGNEERVDQRDYGEEYLDSPFVEFRPSTVTPAMQMPEGRALSDDAFTPDDKRQEQESEEASDTQSGSIRGRMVSEYIDIVRQWDSNEKVRTHAFQILELYLYNKQEISGRPFKDHLFEVIAASGGVGNVWGYLYKKVLSSLAKDSFRTITGDEDNIGDNDRTDFPQSRMDVDLVEVREASEHLRKWIEKRWPKFSINDKLALLCTVLEISMNAPEIVARTTVGRQAFYNRKVLAREALDYLLEKGCSRSAIAGTLAGSFQDILLRFAATDMECKWFQSFYDENRKGAGK